MKLKAIILTLTIVCITQISTSLKAQSTTHTLLNIGYAYQNQSFADVGLKFLFLKNDDVLYRVGASALMGSTNNDFAIMPKLQADILLNFQKDVDLFHSHYFLIGAEATSKYIAPKVGVSLLGIIDLTAGYGFGFSGQDLNGKSLKGFNLNFGINLPFVMINDFLK
ncbi:hypothetical protein G6R40_09200 [Chryseobacterium sp. POL2]|uniref:hypothetical protein n=1 Tax=Chryseobacterium sp. POL2 TaxID=2713414 RepID=UPI0013E10572|nr:hypothetical protein [Chryseobacterium sp. POL2]QIG89827.1 hypothetical protein G6R40_09200 [Chryseobacterium sp. POL2]